MKETYFSEMSVVFQRTKRRYIPQHRTLQKVKIIIYLKLSISPVLPTGIDLGYLKADHVTIMTSCIVMLMPLAVSVVQFRIPKDRNRYS
jgi:hypothetical protein